MILVDCHEAALATYCEFPYVGCYCSWKCYVDCYEDVFCGEKAFRMFSSPSSLGEKREGPRPRIINNCPGLVKVKGA
jgi:hypothetical protein